VDHVERLREASFLFESRLREVPADGWARPTPCSEWDVRTLVTHVVGGEMAVPALLAGGLPAEVFPRLRGDHLGSDPLAAFQAATSAAIDAFAAPGALDQIVHHPTGDIDGGTFARFRIGDLTIHAWDLSRAIGADDRLPSSLVEVVLDRLEPMRLVIGSIGVFGAGPSEDLPAGVDAQARMLDLAGRRP
jgi:uncharacterized protein (TIGR03086 family)